MRFKSGGFFTLMRRPYVLAVFSGILSTLSVVFAPLFFLIWVAFIPLFAALSAQPAGKRLQLGLTAGTVYFGGAFHWLWWSITQFFAFSAFVAALLFLGFLLWHGFFFALFAVTLRPQARTGSRLLLPTLAWVVLEHSYPMLFPWQFGNMLQPHLPAIQLADVTGVAGLSFLILFVNSLLFQAYERWRGKTAWLPPLAAACGVVLALDVYGRWRLIQLEAEPPTRTLQVAVVQGNAPATRAISDEVFQQSLQAHTQLSLSAATPALALIVWPEIAVRATLRTDEAARDALFTLAERIQTPFLVGAFDQAPDGEKLNSAFLVSPAGEFFGSYHKKRLLPFAEALPWPLHIFARWWPSAGFAAGANLEPLLLPGARFTVSICYEALFPGFFRQPLADGAEFLVNLTNDIWLGSTSGPGSHLQAAVLRAVESRRWFVRAANSGISAVIAPSGRIVARTELFTAATLHEQISLRQDITFYTCWGDWFVLVCLAGICLVGVVQLWSETSLRDSG